jgi:GNAT superfamily N-acetyltransferase
LLEAAEEHLRVEGCTVLEVTSGERQSAAHGFYAAYGYVERRQRFVKSVST